MPTTGDFPRANARPRLHAARNTQPQRLASHTPRAAPRTYGSLYSGYLARKASRAPQSLSWVIRGKAVRGGHREPATMAARALGPAPSLFGVYCMTQGRKGTWGTGANAHGSLTTPAPSSDEDPHAGHQAPTQQSPAPTYQVHELQRGEMGRGMHNRVGPELDLVKIVPKVPAGGKHKGTTDGDRSHAGQNNIQLSKRHGDASSVRQEPVAYAATRGAATHTAPFTGRSMRQQQH